MDIRKFVVGQFLLFFIWPFGSFITSLATVHLYKSSRIIFVLFATLYGATFVFDPNELGSDNSRVKEEFLTVAEMDVKSFEEFMKEETTTDVFLPVSFFLVSKISSNAHLLYGYFALIYSVFFILSVTLLLKIIESKKLSFSIILFLFLFILYIRFSAINGVRFWIACFIFIYATLKILVNSNYYYLILIFITPIIHFSYFFGVLIMLVFLLIGNKMTYCYILLGLSIIFPVELVTSYLQSSGLFTLKVDSYFRENNVSIEKGKRANTNFYIEWGAIIAQKFMSFAMFAPVLWKSNYTLNNVESRIYSFLVIYLSFLNFASASFELYRRFFEIFIMICLAYFILIASNEKITFKTPKFKVNLAILTALALTPQIFLGIRSGIETLNCDIMYKSLFQLVNCGNTSVYDFLLHNHLI